MSKLIMGAAAAALFAGGVAAGLALAADAPAEATLKVVFDNTRATVKEVTIAPGARRPPRTREADELVLFPEEAHYQAVEADGKKQARDRAPGTVVFHKKGELAPTLINTGGKVVHYFSITLK